MHTAESPSGTNLNTLELIPFGNYKELLQPLHTLVSDLSKPSFTSQQVTTALGQYQNLMELVVRHHDAFYLGSTASLHKKLSNHTALSSPLSILATFMESTMTARKDSKPAPFLTIIPAILQAKRPLQLQHDQLDTHTNNQSQMLSYSFNTISFSEKYPQEMPSDQFDLVMEKYLATHGLDAQLYIGSSPVLPGLSVAYYFNPKCTQPVKDYKNFIQDTDSFRQLDSDSALFTINLSNYCVFHSSISNAIASKMAEVTTPNSDDEVHFKIFSTTKYQFQNLKSPFTVCAATMFTQKQTVSDLYNKHTVIMTFPFLEIPTSQQFVLTSLQNTIVQQVNSQPKPGLALSFKMQTTPKSLTPTAPQSLATRALLSGTAQREKILSSTPLFTTHFIEASTKYQFQFETHLYEDHILSQNLDSLLNSNTHLKWCTEFAHAIQSRYDVISKFHSNPTAFKKEQPQVYHKFAAIQLDLHIQPLNDESATLIRSEINRMNATYSDCCMPIVDTPKLNFGDSTFDDDSQPKCYVVYASQDHKILLNVLKRYQHHGKIIQGLVKPVKDCGLIEKDVNDYSSDLTDIHVPTSRRQFDPMVNIMEHKTTFQATNKIFCTPGICENGLHFSYQLPTFYSSVHMDDINSAATTPYKIDPQKPPVRFNLAHCNSHLTHHSICLECLLCASQAMESYSFVSTTTGIPNKQVIKKYNNFNPDFVINEQLNEITPISRFFFYKNNVSMHKSSTIKQLHLKMFTMPFPTLLFSFFNTLASSSDKLIRYHKHIYDIALIFVATIRYYSERCLTINHNFVSQCPNPLHNGDQALNQKLTSPLLDVQGLRSQLPNRPYHCPDPQCNLLYCVVCDKFHSKTQSCEYTWCNSNNHPFEEDHRFLISECKRKQTSTPCPAPECFFIFCSNQICKKWHAKGDPLCDNTQCPCCSTNRTFSKSELQRSTIPLPCSNCKNLFCGLCTSWHPLDIRCIGSLKLVKCPTCAIQVEKVDGCNHIICSCGTHFCFLCAKGFPSGNLCYQHIHTAHPNQLYAV